MSFYRGRPLPALGPLTLLILCRGVLDVACVYPVLRRWRVSRAMAAAVSAYLFAALCDIGPLLLPSRFMPAPIRLAHGVEMGLSGIALGLAVAALLAPRQVQRMEAMTVR